MTDETDNLPTGGTDNVAPQADDTASDWDYFDPDEDQDTEAASEPEATDDGTTATDEEADAPQDTAEIEAPVSAVVKMADGTSVKVEDLIRGNMRQEDYSRKTQEVANERNALKTEVQRLEGITQAFVDHLTSMVPPHPPEELLYRDQKAYTVQKEQHALAMAKVQELIALGEKPKEITKTVSDQERQRILAEENGKLASRFPEVATQTGRQKFFEGVVSAAEAIGFSLEELKGISDHRIFALAKYAEMGMKAEKARQVAATKVATVPPVAPKRPGQGAAQPARNAEAVKKFRANPSIRNAAAAWDGD